jgi:hypothetical protein
LYIISVSIIFNFIRLGSQLKSLSGSGTLNKVKVLKRCPDVASLNYASLNYPPLEKNVCSVPGMMRPWEYASLGRFVPGQFVTVCPHFSGRTIHPHFENCTCEQKRKKLRDGSSVLQKKYKILTEMNIRSKSEPLDLEPNEVSIPAPALPKRCDSCKSGSAKLYTVHNTCILGFHSLFLKYTKKRRFK